ncbi:MAG: mannose-1-phosphate guanylyltransferase [Geobacteraceae bacterium]|nr:mannose-1-phosphate guanylyltransferase [Geobacteraceae bacterium]
MYIVILAGGSGTRFWPLSRRKTPKQLMSVVGGKSMLQRTVERVLPLNPERILVVTNVLQAEETERQLAFVKGDLVTVVPEPLARNTAPAIGLAAALIEREDPAAVMVVLPADHHIRDEEEFRKTVLRAEAEAADLKLVTIGIVPTRPETGFGYIEADMGRGRDGVFPVRRFVEKPGLDRACEYLESGDFFWNSGMFVWRADVILDRFRMHMPDLYAGLSVLHVPPDMDRLSSLRVQVADLYGRIDAESVDYGVMEKAEGVVVIPSSFGWSDVGSWSALPEVVEPDGDGNVFLNPERVLCLDSRGSLVRAGERLIALVGVRDLIVVDTGDALLICPKDRAQDVKRVTEALEERGLANLL